MRTMTKSVHCPRCGHPGSLILTEHRDIVAGSEGHHIEFHCSATPRHELSEVEMVKLWVADRVADADHRSAQPS